jgi:ADP-ribosylglycohydrolase
MTELVAIGGDSDTICSIAGQVAGAHLGFSRIPEHLRSLSPVREIFPKAEAFALEYGRG